jgi:hypothetical protein
MANKKLKDAQLNPDDYEGNINAMETAKTVALVVLIINVLYLLYTIYSIATGGLSEAQEQWQKMMEEINQNA